MILGILGPPYCGIGATIRIGREMLCLPYAGFSQGFQKSKKFAHWTLENGGKKAVKRSEKHQYQKNPAQ